MRSVPATWFCALPCRPVTLEGETFTRRNVLLRGLQIWSIRPDQRLVPSDIG